MTNEQIQSLLRKLDCIRDGAGRDNYMIFAKAFTDAIDAINSLTDERDAAARRAMKMRRVCESLASIFEGKDDMADIDASFFVDNAGDTFQAAMNARDALAPDAPAEATGGKEGSENV